MVCTTDHDSHLAACGFRICAALSRIMVRGYHYQISASAQCCCKCADERHKHELTMGAINADKRQRHATPTRDSYIRYLLSTLGDRHEYRNPECSTRRRSIAMANKRLNISVHDQLAPRGTNVEYSHGIEYRNPSPIWNTAWWLARESGTSLKLKT